MVNLSQEVEQQPEEEYDETRENLQTLRVKFLRLALRLGQTDSFLLPQVKLRLELAEQRMTTGARSDAFSRAGAMAEHLESPPGQHEPLGLACTILVIGKSGAGKSATLNSIFDKPVFATDAFGPCTRKIQDHVGTLHGTNVRVIDTPGLSLSDHRQNEKTLRSIKSFMKKTPPDVVLYVDRLDTSSGELGADEALMGTVTSVFGQTSWPSVIVVLTHATSPPPENYDAHVAQRTYIARESIRQASGNTRLLFPVSLVENHSGCPTNVAGQRVLPNGLVWKHHLLLTCFASTILAEANKILKVGPPAPPRRLPHLPSLLSSFLQPRPQVTLPSEQFGNDDDDDDDLDSGSDSEEGEYEYDKLPPFKRLTEGELENLSPSQRKAYYDEIEFREKLFMKKQRKLMREMRETTQEDQETNENDESETLPDPTLPATFDSDNPTHRYRSLKRPSPWTVEPVYDPNGWDHETGIAGANVGRLFVLKEKIPISVSGQFATGRYNKSNLQMEIASSINHGKGKSTSLGFDIEPFGNDEMAYTVRGETLLSNRRMNKASAGLTATSSGGVWTGGVKLVDKLSLGRWVEFEGRGGAICGGSGDVAYSGGLDVRVMDRDDPSGRFSTTLGLNVMELNGEVAFRKSAVIQVPIGRHDNLVARINVNNRGTGKLCVNVAGSNQVQLALIILIPLVKNLLFSAGQKLARLLSRYLH